MPALLPTEFSGKIVWLGRVDPDASGIQAKAVETLALDWEGIPGARHSGLNRPSCGRLTRQYSRGTEIRNTRQLSILSAEETSEVARRLKLDRLDPVLLGATVVLRGLPDLSHLPPSSRLQLSDGGMLVVDMQNRPCHLPAREIETVHPGAGGSYKTASKGLRGITAWVERPGTLSLGDSLRLHIPDQRGWEFLGEARNPSA
ncbi:MOSC domain-containing protein [Litorisediminicola beolgyonensis]|uniref:MOSC domain-containing protein n=1 Tax=Litorisediminicola beolgyonensis TaxID=1173614 RepID=A0ABW3ZN60_9RHOB